MILSKLSWNLLSNLYVFIQLDSTSSYCLNRNEIKHTWARFLTSESPSIPSFCTSNWPVSMLSMNVLLKVCHLKRIQLYRDQLKKYVSQPQIQSDGGMYCRSLERFLRFYTDHELWSLINLNYHNLLKTFVRITHRKFRWKHKIEDKFCVQPAAINKLTDRSGCFFDVIIYEIPTTWTYINFLKYHTLFVFAQKGHNWSQIMDTWLWR